MEERMRMLPLLFLPKPTRQILSILLNSKKVIPADKDLLRDWRGLAALAGITSEVQASIHNYPDKTARVLDIWNGDSSVTVGMLLDNLMVMDRYDIIDDFCEDLVVHLSKGNKGVLNQVGSLPNIGVRDQRSEILTSDDYLGYCHTYDAYVLYANQDQKFVGELCNYLDSNGFQVCTKNKLLPGQITCARITKLITDRCQRIILVYSPDFFNSSDDIFSNFIQAVSFESQDKIIPIMYRTCKLPSHLLIYHYLRYNSSLYNFWAKLKITIQGPITPCIEISQPHSSIAISEMSNPNQNQSLEENHLKQQIDTIKIDSLALSIISDTSKVNKNILSKLKRFLQ